MGWPIILTAKQSAAVIEVVRRYLAERTDHHSMLRYQVSVVLSQMERGFSLDPPEQELLRFLLIQYGRSMPDHWPELETACFRLFGIWPKDPPWWGAELKAKGYTTGNGQGD